MILVDTSVWVAHLRAGEPALAALLETGQVLIHPFVIGELALGHMQQRQTILTLLQGLPAVSVAMDGEMLFFIERHGLAGLGIGYVDAHLLAAAKLTTGSRIWTHDKRLAAVATNMGLAHFPTPDT